MQFKLSKYSNRETPDSCNLLRCLDVDDQDGFQVWDKPNDELKQRSLRFGLVSFILLMQTFSTQLTKTNSVQHLRPPPIPTVFYSYIYGYIVFFLHQGHFVPSSFGGTQAKVISSTAISLPLFPVTPLSPHKPRCICGKQQSPKPWGYILHALGASYRTSDFTLCTSASSPVPDSQGFCDVWLWTWLTST